ncbi:Bax inhibitor-1/YccA family protein [Candidatus Cytomitobacter indipagum]|uniref:Bax inhibitor-1/YccA family protein n=1 Tax=Candidatus Cytomitobacter indipagum TaxID=2601575 RepID=A0A5C0UF14_9PROT|nr:Bax inhibitor-1/YccA family protein [Candidatus Cytomitobacter indipagum]QEK38271.1 Bax inhibitor-1/YccA family protein [Candidatus Cytomitobacter indipagum]
MNKDYIVHSDSGLRRYFAAIYQNVGIGLAVMGSIAYFMHSMKLYPRGFGGLLVMFLPMIISVGLSTNIRRMSVETAQLMYMLFSASLGISLSAIFAIYTGESIVSAFLSTAAIFGGLSYYARVTDRDLSKMGNILQASLIGLILSSLINMFFWSSVMNIVLSLATIVIFSGFIVYDHGMLTNLYYSRVDVETKEKIAIIGALQLLMSFVNIFISLLSLLGERRRD